MRVNFYYYDLKNKLLHGNIEKSFVIIGDEFYFLYEVRNLLKKFAKDIKYEYVVEYLDETKLGDALMDAESNSIFERGKVLVFRVPSKQKLSKIEKRVLGEVIGGKNYLIFEYPMEYNIFEKNKRGDLENFLMDRVPIYNLKRLDKYHAKKWIYDFVKKRGGRIDEESAEYLVEKYNCDLNKVVQTLENFFLYESDMGNFFINLEKLSPFLYSYSDYSPSEFVDAFLDRDVARCITIFNALSGDVSNLMSILGLLVWFFQKMNYYFLMKRDGISSHTIRSKLGVGDRNFRNIEEKSKNFSISEIEKIICGLGEIERVIKSGSKMKDVLFQKMIFQLLSHDVKYKSINF